MSFRANTKGGIRRLYNKTILQQYDQVTTMQEDLTTLRFVKWTSDHHVKCDNITKSDKKTSAVICTLNMFRKQQNIQYKKQQNIQYKRISQRSGVVYQIKAWNTMCNVTNGIILK